MNFRVPWNAGRTMEWLHNWWPLWVVFYSSYLHKLNNPSAYYMVVGSHVHKILLSLTQDAFKTQLQFKSVYIVYACVLLGCIVGEREPEISLASCAERCALQQSCHLSVRVGNNEGRGRVGALVWLSIHVPRRYCLITTELQSPVSIKFVSHQALQ
jgi:hypothetical protein